MIKKEYMDMLISELHITPEFAENICKRLEKCHRQIYIDLIKDYACNGTERYYEKNGYSTENIMTEYEIDYLNAVMMLVWIETSPNEAVEALESGIDYIK